MSKEMDDYSSKFLKEDLEFAFEEKGFKAVAELICEALERAFPADRLTRELFAATIGGLVLHGKG